MFNAETKIKEAKENTQKITDMVNSSAFSAKEFCEAMTHEHRYLQGEFFQLCLEWIKTCAKDDYPTDGRNEWCHTYAKELQKTIEEKF